MPTHQPPLRRPLTRRQLLHLTSATTAALAWPDHAWSQTRFATNPFQLGVASGSPTHDSIVLWTRLLQDGPMEGSTLGDKQVAVRWDIAHDTQFTRMARSGQAQAHPALAYSVHVEVDGLQPDRWYFYRFRVGDAVSATGRTRTFPAPDAEAMHMRLAYASCQRWDHGYFSAYRHMAAENLDAVLFLGDYIYEYPTSAYAVRVPTGGWVTTLEGYRARYALHRSDADLQAMHAVCPWIVTWDDHEVQNDYAGHHPGQSGKPNEDFAARRAAAYQAYYEHMPLRASVLTQGVGGLASGAEMRIYGQVAFGKLATFYVLDDRQYRDAQACTPDNKAGAGTVRSAQCPSWTQSQRTLLGTAQEQWLDEALSQGRPGWNVIAQQTLFGARDFHKTGPEQTLWNDGWDGYPAARQRVITSLQQHRVSNPVLLGGDVHENWVGHVKADYSQPNSVAVGVEFCGTSITSHGGGNNKIAERLARNPHFIFADTERHGYGVVDITPQQLTTTLRVVDDVRKPDSNIETLAKFVVHAGKPLVQRIA
jgi:alkaline phosphatase D